MSAFGALPLDVRRAHVDAVAASSNKCIEGVPGLGFVICRREALVATKGQATTLVLDLHDQWANLEKTGQYRFTPPIHVIVAFHQALREFAAEGGVEGRGRRYRENCRILVSGMRELGFRTLLPDHLQAPIIVTFHMPTHPRFVFQRFLRWAEGAWLCDLSGQADRRGLLPHRLHRAHRRKGDAAGVLRPCARCSTRWA